MLKQSVNLLFEAFSLALQPCRFVEARSDHIWKRGRGLGGYSDWVWLRFQGHAVVERVSITRKPRPKAASSPALLWSFLKCTVVTVRFLGVVVFSWAHTQSDVFLKSELLLTGKLRPCILQSVIKACTWHVAGLIIVTSFTDALGQNNKVCSLKELTESVCLQCKYWARQPRKHLKSKDKTTALEMIQNLPAWLPLHAYLSLCHPGLCTLGFIRTVLVEKTQPELLHGLVRWARSSSAYHLSIPPPFPCLPLSLSGCLTLPCCLSLPLPLSEPSLPHWQALMFSSSLPLSLCFSLSFIPRSFFLSQSLYPPLHHHHIPPPPPPPPPPLPSFPPPRLLRAPPH